MAMKNGRLIWKIFLLFLLLPAVQAEETSSPPGLLIRGPLERRGIPLESTNVVPCRYGLYHWRGGDYEVSFVDIFLEMGEDWKTLECGRLRLLQRQTPGSRVFYYPSLRDGAVFITAPGVSEEELCLFTEVFVERFSYFQAISSSFSFPAVLEIGSKS